MKSLDRLALFLSLQAALTMAVPSTMRAFVAHNYVGTNFDEIKVEVISVPVPRTGEVLIQIRGSSVNPVDWKIIEQVCLIFLFILSQSSASFFFSIELRYYFLKYSINNSHFCSALGGAQIPRDVRI